MVKQKNNLKSNLLEKILYISSALLVFSVIIFLIVQSVNYNVQPPDLTVDFKLHPSPSNKNLYHVRLHNQGGETAENVKIELELFREGKSVEKSEIEIPFSPKKSEREGWINFSMPPSPSDSVVPRIMSYKKP